jgi:hypothetical protein
MLALVEVTGCAGFQLLERINAASVQWVRATLAGLFDADVRMTLGPRPVAHVTPHNATVPDRVRGWWPSRGRVVVARCSEAGTIDPTRAWSTEITMAAGGL